ncbi:MAG TPA: alpha/beta hydrolase [Hyphomicrobiaceae bacterium]|nr:alpha/beta hydrolase [Hyphomicrobiaceae bacterium]
MSQGHLDGRAVVFIHGIGGSARAWSGQVASFLAAGFAPVAVDLPGYGGRPPVSALDFEGMAEDVEDFMAAGGILRPVLVGHSMGGMVAQTLLRRRPEGYAAAVLACTSPAFGSADGAFQRKFVADRLGALDAGETMAELAPRMVERMIGPRPDAAGRAHAVDVMRRVPADTYRAAVRCLVTFDERANLARITTPVLCLAGENDPNAPPPVVERMAARIAAAEYVCLPSVGHLPNLEAPVAFNQAVLGFLSKVTSRP